MTKKVTKRKITRILKSSTVFNAAGEFVGGGILNPTNHVNTEMWVEIMDDPVLDHTSDQWGVTGRLQIHLGSTRKAMEELGTFLLSLSHYHPPEPGYSLSFELTDSSGKPAIHFVVHLPVETPEVKSTFSKVHNVATATITKGGEVHETTLPRLPLDNPDKPQEPHSGNVAR